MRVSTARTWRAVILMGAALAAMQQPCSAETVQTVYRFTGGSDGGNPSGVVAGPYDSLYVWTGTTVDRVNITPQGRWHVVPMISGSIQSLVPYGKSLFGVVKNGGTHGYGTIVQLRYTANGWTTTTIYEFAGGTTDGVSPVGITVDANGVIYGLTQSGGGSQACGSTNGVPNGCGTLFSLTKTGQRWKEKVLHALAGGADGQAPLAAPTLDSAGNVFATTYLGGASSGSSRVSPDDETQGSGAMYYYKKLYGWAIASWVDPTNYFEFSPYIVPHAGTHVNANAASDTESVIAAATEGGRTSACGDIGNEGCGVVFMVTGRPGNGKAWRYTLIHKFGEEGGAAPQGSLTALDASTLYGVAPYAGRMRSACGSLGCGTIYKLVNSGTGWRWGGVVWKFSGGPRQGSQPSSPLALYHGMIVGTTQYGGISNSHCAYSNDQSCGTLFTLTP